MKKNPRLATYLCITFDSRAVVRCWMIRFQFAEKKYVNRLNNSGGGEYKSIQRNLFSSSCWRAVAMVYITMIG